jgi:hypothetical protein
MAIGDDVKNTTFSDLQPAQSYRRAMLRKTVDDVLSFRKRQKTKKKPKDEEEKNIKS